MRVIKNKKGFGHFEMVISFMFFMGFMIFLFSVLSVNNNVALPDTISSGLHDNFIKITSTNLSTVFLKANYTGKNNCFYINFPDDFFNYKTYNGTSYVASLDGQNLSSGLVGNELNIENVGTFFNIKISPEFNDSGLGNCAILNNFVLGPVTEMKVTSYSSLEKMQNEYFNNYKGLKTKLGVPPSFDFSIVADNLPIKMSPKQGVPNSIDVTAKDYMIEVLKSNGDLINERFVFRIW